LDWTFLIIFYASLWLGSGLILVLGRTV